jgi:protein-S-isoprenylcysteine O-methyltransferase Ste14
MNGNFLQRGGLWVLGQSVLLCAVIAGGILSRHQWQSLALTLCGAFLLLIVAGCGWAGTVSLGQNLTPFPKPSASSTLVQTGIYTQRCSAARSAGRWCGEAGPRSWRR